MGKWKIILKNGVKGPIIPPGKLYVEKTIVN